MKKSIIVLACVMGLSLGVGSGQAAITQINLNYPPATDDPYYVGSINDGIPSNPTDELLYIANLKTLAPGAGPVPISTETYNRVGSIIAIASLPSITGDFKYKEANNDLEADAPLDGSWTFNLDDGFYILGKYNAGAAGALVWFVDDAAFGDVFTLPATFDGFELSHLSVYSDGSPVPVPGSFVLFGSGLIGLAGIARRRCRA